MHTAELAERLLALGWDGNFPICPWRLADRLRVYHRELPEDGAEIIICLASADHLDGDSQRIHFERDAQRFVITVNHDQNHWRQRFGVMHGVASLFLGVVSLDGTPVRRQDFRGDYGKTHEANKVTLRTLLPARYLRHQASQITDVVRLSTLFGVSPFTVRVRLKQLGML